VVAVEAVMDKAILLQVALVVAVGVIVLLMVLLELQTLVAVAAELGHLQEAVVTVVQELLSSDTYINKI
jgi:hypothetical protein